MEVNRDDNPEAPYKVFAKDCTESYKYPLCDITQGNNNVTVSEIKKKALFFL